MKSNALERFIEAVGRAWGPLTTETVEGCRRGLQALAQAAPPQAWLEAVQGQSNTELHRDAARGFVLLTHEEPQGRYRPPHDHGRGWVVYAVVHGEVEMGTYVRTTDAEGRVRLVQREAYPMQAGDCRVFLPGDIHDTRCLSGSVRMLRFTSRDLEQEEQDGHLTRYVQRDGVWTVAS